MSSLQLKGHSISMNALEVAHDLQSAELDINIGHKNHLMYSIGRLMNSLHEAFAFADIDFEECRQVYLAEQPRIKAENKRRRAILEAAE